jgi:hypothetical protein
MQDERFLFFLLVFMYILCHRNPVVKVSPTITVVGNGVLSPRVASFSSRGPSPLFPGILKVYINIITCLLGIIYIIFKM